ncbi:MAG: hypothetical protein AB7S36_08000 [Planctomycetota bacterium]
MSKTSKKQIEANRKNAQKSTGPRTEAGKRAASLNRWKHGLTATTVVGPDEDMDAYLELRHSLRMALEPANAHEDELADRIIVNAWKRRRAEQMETACVTRISGGYPWFQPHTVILQTIMRYRTGIEREYHRSVTSLRLAQKERIARDKQTALALALDQQGGDEASPRKRLTAAQLMAVTLIHSWNTARAARLAGKPDTLGVFDLDLNLAPGESNPFPHLFPPGAGFAQDVVDATEVVETDQEIPAVAM